MIDDLESLKSTMTELGNELESLRERLSEGEDRLGELRKARTGGPNVAALLDKQEGLVLALRREIQRRKIQLGDLTVRLASAEISAQADQRGLLRQRNDALREELDLLRRELLKSLLGMAELLRRHKRLAEEKLRVSRELVELTGADLAYENYLACAVLHQKDYVGDVQFVAETIKKARPVA